MKNIYVLMLCSVFLLAGCSMQESGDDNYMSGTEGISLTFVGNNPPSTIYYDRTYVDASNVEIEARNRGTSPSSNVEIFFAGYDENIVDIGTVSGIDFSQEDMYRTRYNPEGGYNGDSTELRIIDLGNADEYTFNLKAVYCYDYETQAAIQLCVDPNPNRVNSDDACTPSNVGTNGQGAPVGISNIDMETMPGNVRLKMSIQHYGQGDVLRAGTSCRGIPERADEDYVEFSTPRLGGISGDCITQSPLKLRDGKGTIICNFQLDRESSAYRTILEMELFNYQIKDSIQKNIKIINEEDTFR